VHKFKHAGVGGAGVTKWENGLAGEGRYMSFEMTFEGANRW